MTTNMSPAGDFRSIIISDLHVSSGPLDDFDAELETHFVRFLDSLAAGGPVELVINGDFLDFVQAPPWRGQDLESSTSQSIPLCFTEQQSRAKLSAIAASHAPMFRALGRLAAAGSHNRIVILPGNHDPDLFWPHVQSDLRTLLTEGTGCAEEQITVHLDQVYRPMANDAVWIEHGHQYDPVNRFTLDGQSIWSGTSGPVLDDKNGTPRLFECTGTRFLIKYLNRLDAEYPFVDNVKPFSRFVRMFGASAFVPGYGPLKAAVAMWAMLRYLAGTAIRRPSDLLGVDAKTAPDLELRLIAALEKLSDQRKRQFTEELEQAGFPLDSRSPESVLRGRRAGELLDFLAEHPELLDPTETSETVLSTHGGKGTLTLAKGFGADETQDLIDAASAVAARESGIETVVMGHTHQPVTKQDATTYFNTGSWTRYYQFGQKEKTHAWSLLRQSALANFPFQLLYVEVPAKGGGEPQLHEYKEPNGGD